jgi:hypothetical protein
MSDFGEIKTQIYKRVYEQHPKDILPKYILISFLNTICDKIQGFTRQDNLDSQIGSVKMIEDDIWIPYEGIGYITVRLGDVSQNIRPYCYVFFDVRLIDKDGKIYEKRQKTKIELSGVRHSFSNIYQYECNGYFIAT